MSIRVNGKIGIDLIRITQRIDLMGADREGVSDVLDNVGKMMAQEAHLESGKLGIDASGKLRNSINHRVSTAFNKATVTVGPKGVYYARFQEMGAERTPASRRAMFAKLRDIGLLGASPAKPGFRSDHHMARPFLKPAFDRHAYKTIQLLRELFRQGV